GISLVAGNGTPRGAGRRRPRNGDNLGGGGDGADRRARDGTPLALVSAGADGTAVPGFFQDGASSASPPPRAASLASGTNHSQQGAGSGGSARRDESDGSGGSGGEGYVPSWTSSRGPTHGQFEASAAPGAAAASNLIGAGSASAAAAAVKSGRSAGGGGNARQARARDRGNAVAAGLDATAPLPRPNHLFDDGTDPAASHPPRGSPWREHQGRGTERERSNSYGSMDTGAPVGAASRQNGGGWPSPFVTDDEDSRSATPQSPQRAMDSSMLTSLKKNLANRRGSRQQQHQQLHRQAGAAAAEAAAAGGASDAGSWGVSSDGTRSHAIGRRAASAAAASMVAADSRRWDEPDGGVAAASAQVPFGRPSRTEPQTPMPVGVYDGRGERLHMQTAAQQPMPFARRGGGGDDGLSDAAVRSGDVEEGSFPEHEGGFGGNPDSRPIRPMPEWLNRSNEDGAAPDGGPARQHSPVVAKTRAPHTSMATLQRQQRLREQQKQRQQQQEENGNDNKACAYGDVAMQGAWLDQPLSAAAGGAANCTSPKATAARNESRSSPPRHPAVVPPSVSPTKMLALKAETFDYLRSEDFRPSPSPQQELVRTLASLEQDDWPEIYHSLN
ncbi:unnamed protein product, partial [Phaeothamnion confervicola]